MGKPKLVSIPVCPKCGEVGADGELYLGEDHTVVCAKCGVGFDLSQVESIYRQFEDIGEGLLVPVEELSSEEEDEEEGEDERDDLDL